MKSKVRKPIPQKPDTLVTVTEPRVVNPMSLFQRPEDYICSRAMPIAQCIDLASRLERRVGELRSYARYLESYAPVESAGRG